MLYQEEKINYKNHTITFRSAVDEDAPVLVDYLKKVSGETPYLLSEPEEINLTLEDEYRFIHKYNSSDSSLLLLAFVDDEYAGNCSFSVIHVYVKDTVLILELRYIRNIPDLVLAD